jgi:hypothetical protein
VWAELLHAPFVAQCQALIASQLDDAGAALYAPLSVCLDAGACVGGRCLEAAWKLPRSCPEAAQKLPRICLESAQKLPRRRGRRTLRAAERVPRRRCVCVCPVAARSTTQHTTTHPAPPSSTTQHHPASTTHAPHTFSSPTV